MPGTTSAWKALDALPSTRTSFRARRPPSLSASARARHDLCTEAVPHVVRRPRRPRGGMTAMAQGPSLRIRGQRDCDGDATWANGPAAMSKIWAYTQDQMPTPDRRRHPRTSRRQGKLRQHHLRERGHPFSSPAGRLGRGGRLLRGGRRYFAEHQFGATSLPGPACCAKSASQQEALFLWKTRGARRPPVK